MPEGSWLTIADGVLARRYPELDLSVGLVLGDRYCLVIDARGDHEQGTEWAAAVREITSLPPIMVYTHAHFDHTFGASAFRPCPVWAHERCAHHLRDRAGEQRQHWVRHYERAGDPRRARAIESSPLVSPDHPVTERAELDLGGRRVVLLHPGRGHTDHDLVVHLPDERVVFTGDLVEHGAPPQFGDAYPQEWPTALETVRALGARVAIPGHGNPATPDFLVAQQADIAILANVCRAVRQGDLTEEAALRESPYPEDTTREALLRTYRDAGQPNGTGQPRGTGQPSDTG